MQENQRRLEGIRRERSSVEEELQRLRTEVHSLSDELANIERQRQTTNLLVNELDRQINGLGGQIDQTTVDLLLAQDALLEKQAVRHGGGSNHRIGLFDGVMIKDNHIAALGGDRAIGEAVPRARSRIPHTVKIEVEVANLDQLRLALDAGAEIILLDNMPVAMMREAVAITAGRALLEASGGVNLATVRAIAETGVDLISVGALTHSAPALDISLELWISG